MRIHVLVNRYDQWTQNSSLDAAAITKLKITLKTHPHWMGRVVSPIEQGIIII